jgi:hypothetical protein
MFCFIIYRTVKNKYLCDYGERVGVVLGDYLKAQEVVDKLNSTESKPVYYRTEVPILTLENCLTGE